MALTKKSSNKNAVYTNEQFPISPSGYGIATGDNDIIISFFWVPPEKKNERRMIARLILDHEQLIDLSKIFTDEAKDLEKKKSKKKQK